MTRPLLGCIADDLTGATDLAGSLVREGLRVTLVVGVPDDPRAPEADAIVVALKSRSIPAAEAIALSLRSLAWLRSIGAERIYLKYASTFDSTPRGNIGPVTEALQAELGARITVACPAFPANGRTVREGILFVGSQPLADSPMRHHPLNPMTESSVVRLLAAQVTEAVGLVPLGVVEAGPSAIATQLRRLSDAGHRHAVADAVTDTHVRSIADAVADEPLATGGSALGAAIGGVLRDRGIVAGGDPATPRESEDRARPGWSAVVAGSCSTATLGQVAEMATRHPFLALDAGAIAAGEDVRLGAVAWARERLPAGPVLIYSSAAPSDVEAVRASHGPAAGEAIERTLAGIASDLVGLGVRRLVIAGGETAGAVVDALGIRTLRVGPEIEPGVPVVHAAEPAPLSLVLKSGNFGSPRFFELALEAAA